MYACMHVCMYVCMYVRMYVCMHVRMCFVLRVFSIRSLSEQKDRHAGVAGIAMQARVDVWEGAVCIDSTPSPQSPCHCRSRRLAHVVAFHKPTQGLA